MNQYFRPGNWPGFYEDEDGNYDDRERRRADLERHERAELARLLAKYGKP
jgi:hypothetical protein